MKSRHSHPFGYNGSHKLKRAGVKLNYTPWQAQEIAKCENDYVYFIENYIKIRHVDHGTIAFNMFDFQRDLVDIIHNNRFTVTEIARQSGKSVLVIGYAIWYCIFNDVKNVALLANKGDTARKLLKKFRESYEHLPIWLQQGVVEANKSTIEFENQTVIYATATSKDSVRGDSLSMCIVDEAAFVDPEEKWNEFWKATYPTISSGKASKMILISTPNGMNHFYHIRNKAKPWDEEFVEGKHSHFVLYSATWRARPDRDDVWRQQEIDNTSLEQFQQEHELQYMGSQGTLISISKLSTLRQEDPLRLMHDAKFKIFVEPVKHHKYVAIVDVAKGVGLDYSVVNVIDVSVNGEWDQVAIFRDNKLSHYMLPNMATRIATMYNDALMVVENNDLGSYVSNKIYEDLEYENMYFTDTIDEQGGKTEVGMRQTVRSKRLGCNNIKSIIEEDKLNIRDGATISEFANFALTPNKKSYEASSGHDDTVMTLVILGWLTGQENFRDDIEADLLEEIFEGKIEDLDEEFDDEMSMGGFGHADGSDIEIPGLGL